MLSNKENEENGKMATPKIGRILIADIEAVRPARSGFDGLSLAISSEFAVKESSTMAKSWKRVSSAVTVTVHEYDQEYGTLPNARQQSRAVSQGLKCT